MYIPGNLKMKNWIRIYVILQPYCVLYEYVQCTYTCTYVQYTVQHGQSQQTFFEKHCTENVCVVYS